MHAYISMGMHRKHEKMYRDREQIYTNLPSIYIAIPLRLPLLLVITGIVFVSCSFRWIVTPLTPLLLSISGAASQRCKATHIRTHMHTHTHTHTNASRDLPRPLHPWWILVAPGPAFAPPSPASLLSRIYICYSVQRCLYILYYYCRRHYATIMLLKYLDW